MSTSCVVPDDSVALSLRFEMYAKSWYNDAKVASASFHILMACTVESINAEFHHDSSFLGVSRILRME